MSFVTIAAILIVLGYTVFTRVSDSSPQSFSEPKVQGDSSDASSSATPDPSSSLISSATPSASPKISNSPKVTQKVSDITISVDTQTENKSSEVIVYPGATGSGKIYETSTDGDTVYSWYKNELEKRNFSIRNNVRTKANDKFKGVLQGVSGNDSIKVTISQENAGAKTIIVFE